MQALRSELRYASLTDLEDDTMEMSPSQLSPVGIEYVVLALI